MPISTLKMNLLKFIKSKLSCLLQISRFKMVNNSEYMQMHLLSFLQMIFIHRSTTVIWSRDLKLTQCVKLILPNIKISYQICSRFLKKNSLKFKKLMIRFLKLENLFKNKKYWNKSYMFNISRKWKLYKKMKKKKQIICKKNFWNKLWRKMN